MSENIQLRSGTPADAEICGRICYNAFKTISEAHGFPPDFPTPEVAIGVLRSMLANPKFYSVIAEVDGRIVGSNFLDERNTIAGVGPITVDPTVQNRAIGRRLMDAAHERAAGKEFRRCPADSGWVSRAIALFVRQTWLRCARTSGVHARQSRLEFLSKVISLGQRSKRTSRLAIACAEKCTDMIAVENCRTQSRRAPQP